MSEPIRVCEADAVPQGAPLRVEREGAVALVVFRVGERYFVCVDKCTHGLGVLSQGDQDGSTIACPLHGGEFDIPSGQVLRFPCRIPLRTIEAQQSQGALYIGEWPST
jgi:ethylbenzene dioxygenase ferredoxin component